MLVRLGVTVAARLLLVGGARVDGGDVAVIPLVLRRQHLVLMAQVAHLLAQSVPQERLLGVSERGPRGRAQQDTKDDGAPRGYKAGTWYAGLGERDGGLSHAESLAATFGVRRSEEHTPELQSQSNLV